jgi:putative transposase
LRFTTVKKRKTLDRVLNEYGRVVNAYIDLFWFNPPKNNNELKVSIIRQVSSWFSTRLKKMAAREALSMVYGVRNRKRTKGEKTTPKKPRHRGKKMVLCSTNVSFRVPRTATGFDAWLHVYSIGEKIIFDIPIQFHKHFNGLELIGKRLNSYVITRDHVQFCFEIETGTKLPLNEGIGIDTGINALASVSTGQQYGRDIKSCIERVKRCKHGSKGQTKARRALRQRIDEVAKEVVSIPDISFIVVEKLTGITKNTKNPKRRLGKSIRRSIGAWNVRYWLTRVEQQCERNRVSFRTVHPHYTSQMCSMCGHIDRMNRNGEMFCCLKCGHKDNADVQASRNILNRFITGMYGSGCKGKYVT